MIGVQSHGNCSWASRLWQNYYFAKTIYNRCGQPRGRKTVWLVVVTLVGRSILDLSETSNLSMEVISGLRADRPAISARHIHRRSDGSAFYVNVAYDCCEWNGETWICKYVQDATEAERTERQLRESHERFMAVADYTYDWESWINEAGEVVWVNPAVENHTGFTVSEC